MASHILRCGPDTIRAVATEVLESREAMDALRHEGYEEGMRDGQAEATGAQADFWTMALRYFKEHGAEPASDDGEGHNAYQMMDALFEHVRNIRAEKDARIAELEAALAKAKETADAEFTAKLRYRDERMAAEAEVKRLTKERDKAMAGPGYGGIGRGW
jgi:septal ring factor EnvC (AmiA/AmiB activator)